MSVLEVIIVESCVGLFAAFEAPLRRVTGTSTGARSVPPEELTAAFLGFTGGLMRGMLVLQTTFDLVAACRPREVRSRSLSANSAGDWIYVRDWSKELANQLLGRIKRQLIPHGLTFDIGTPTALTGLNMTRALSGLAVEPIRFVSAVTPVALWFDVKTTPDADAKLAKDKPNEPTREGDIVLF